MAVEGSSEQTEALWKAVKDIRTGQIPLEIDINKVGTFSAELAAELHRLASKPLMSW